MNGNTIANVLAGLVAVALITTVVSHKDSANVITAVGKSTADLFRAAQGR